MTTRMVSSWSALALLSVLVTPTAQAQDLEVVVTGSRIPRAEAEGPTAVTALAAKDLEAQGYKNVFDALNQQTQNTGFTQGADFGNTFTPAANALSLRGLGPNHTLVLINGRRVAEYPTAYDGSVNFVNLANIPSASIDRIETLNGGASAIYGSDAIAGVVNIITKDHVNGTDVNVKAGTTERGGGSNGRFQLSGGADFDKLSTVFAVEISKTDPIWSRDRDFMSSTTLHGAAPTNVWSRLNLDTNRYVAAASTCAGLAGNFYGSTQLTTGRQGTFCGSGEAQTSYWTVQTGNESQNLYTSLNYQLNDTAKVFGDVIVGLNRTKNNTRGPNWTSAAPDGGYFFNQTTGNYELWNRRIAPEEIGGATAFNREWKDHAVNVIAGLSGEVGQSGWNYEVAYNQSSYASRELRPRFLSNVDAFFLGEKLGEDADGIPIYAPDAAKFSQPVTAAEFATITGESRAKNSSRLQGFSVSGNGELFELPAGPLKSAGVIEWGSQRFENRPDSRINEGTFFNVAAQDIVKGSRERYAGAIELSAPVIEKVNLTLAARFDHYSFARNTHSKPTYNAGLEFRPIDSVLVRSNYATSFRAPDMNYIYQTRVNGYYASTTDYYRCQITGQPLSSCEFSDYSPGADFTQNGASGLEFENGRSYGYGVVWSPSSRFDIAADYWNIRIDDLVTNLDADTLLRVEADCRTGAQDPASAQCVDALTRIVRNAPTAPVNPNGISRIFVNPINAALERTSGIDVSGKLKWQLRGDNDFLWSLAYTRVLSHGYKQFEGDAERDFLRSLENVDWRSKVITSLTWTRHSLSSTLQVSRFGRLPNGAQEEYLTPTAIANVSVDYQATSHASVSVIVHNVLDTIKLDSSAGWPFYPVGSYSPYGREGWLSFSYHFGS